MESSYNLLLTGDSRTDDIPIQETTTFSYTNTQLYRLHLQHRAITQRIGEES